MDFLLWSRPYIQSGSGWVYCSNSHATAVLVGTSCLAGQCQSMQGPALDKTVDFPSSGLYSTFQHYESQLAFTLVFGTESH